MRDEELLRAAVAALGSAVLLLGGATVAIRGDGSDPARATVGVSPAAPQPEFDQDHIAWGDVGGSGQWWWSDGTWRSSPGGAPSLNVGVFDGDIGFVVYRPHPPGTRGEFYVGSEPSEYFGEPAGAAVDAPAEARGFAQWVKAQLGREVAPEEIESLIARSGAERPDVFAEETLDRLFTLIGLEPPTADAAPLG